MKKLTNLATFVLLAAAACAADGAKPALKDLPAPVQKAIEEQSRGGRVLHIAKEK